MAEDERYPTNSEAAEKEATSADHEKLNDADETRKANSELKIRMFTLDETMYWGREGTPSVIQCSQAPLTRTRQCFRHGGDNEQSFNRLIKTLLDHTVVIGQPSCVGFDGVGENKPHADTQENPCSDTTDIQMENNEDRVGEKVSLATQEDLSCPMTGVEMENGQDCVESAAKNEPIDEACQSDQDCWWIANVQTVDWEKSENIGWETSVGGQWSNATTSQSGRGEVMSENAVSVVVDQKDASRNTPYRGVCTITNNISNDNIVLSETVNDVVIANNCEQVAIEGSVGLQQGAAGNDECVNSVGEAVCKPAVEELRPVVEKLISDRFDEICCSCVDDYANTEDFDYKKDATSIDVETFELHVEAVHTAYINISNAAAAFTARASSSKASSLLRRLLSPDDERFIEFTFRECLRHTDQRLFRLLVLIVTMLHIVAAHFNALSEQVCDEPHQAHEEQSSVVLEEPMYTSTAEIFLNVPSVNSPTVVLI